VIHLSFSLPEPGSPWLKTWDSAKKGDPAAISEIDLRYKYFGVNFELVVGDVEIVSKKRFVTLVDLTLSLSSVLERVSSGQDAAFDFTENEEVIHLRRDGDLVAVSSSTRPVQASVESEELVGEVVQFLRTAHSRLVAEIPELSANPVIQRFSLE
jgi:hypothetical protein